MTGIDIWWAISPLVLCLLSKLSWYSLCTLHFESSTHNSQEPTLTSNLIQPLLTNFSLLVFLVLLKPLMSPILIATLILHVLVTLDVSFFGNNHNKRLLTQMDNGMASTTKMGDTKCTASLILQSLSKMTNSFGLPETVVHVHQSTDIQEANVVLLSSIPSSASSAQTKGYFDSIPQIREASRIGRRLPTISERSGGVRKWNRTKTAEIPGS